MKVSLDKNGYFTGNYATVGDIENSIEVESMPDEIDQLKFLCYKYEDANWIFDSKRYQSLLTKQQLTEITQQKQEMIEQSKKNLKLYLETQKLSSSCHAGLEKQYSITSEKQQLLASMILMTQMATMNGQPYQASWNASGEPCTYDWTLGELQQLAMEIEAFVRPLVSKQQSMEAQILEAVTKEELDAISIIFD